jgi:hypothetical protein
MFILSPCPELRRGAMCFKNVGWAIGAQKYKTASPEPSAQDILIDRRLPIPLRRHSRANLLRANPFFKPISGPSMIFRTIVTAMLGLAPLPAFAMEVLTYLDAQGPPMPNRLYLKLVGEIIEGDADRLDEALRDYDDIPLREVIVYLDSPGGSLAESLQIAKDLRARDEILLTHVGEEGSTGLCASACVAIFAAGDLRYMSEKGRVEIYQDPQGRSEAAANPALREAVTTFYAEQGVSERLVRVMENASVESDISENRGLLEEWGLLTGDVISQSMDRVIIDGSEGLRLKQRSIYGENEVILSCTDQGRISGKADIDQPEGVVAGEFYAVIDGASMEPFSSTLKVRDRRTEVSFELAPFQANLLRGAGSFGARVMAVSREGFWGFEYEIQGPELRTFIEVCSARP